MCKYDGVPGKVNYRVYGQGSQTVFAQVKIQSSDSKVFGKKIYTVRRTAV